MSTPTLIPCVPSSWSYNGVVLKVRFLTGDGLHHRASVRLRLHLRHYRRHLLQCGALQAQEGAAVLGQLQVCLLDKMYVY